MPLIGFQLIYLTSIHYEHVRHINHCGGTYSGFMLVVMGSNYNRYIQTAGFVYYN